MLLQGLNVRGIRTEAIFGDDHLEVMLGVELTLGVILTKLADEALGRVALTIIFGRPILFDNRLRHERNKFQSSDMKSRLSGWMSAAPSIWWEYVTVPFLWCFSKHDSQ